MPQHTTLWRPVGGYELRLIQASGMRAFPPRLPEQPIFYPVCNADYAALIASKWNLSDPNSAYSGFVTEFQLPTAYLAQFERQVVGGAEHEELWVPAEELETFCANMIDGIRVTRGWLGPKLATISSWTGEAGEIAPDALSAFLAWFETAALRGGLLTQG